ncbi:stage II sporulation protein E [Clostridium sp. DJ247]|uniref:stage II sporulation protein E n=1 Tax=Clostridium sp. DJ247 TaxID=2726188 RepID=UPI001625D130|nr:stage II sporulation protein E [Clostridium sp. DJ247]MBC2582589.1 stage II sporulation protein E [Clostridium sp. DJ247]
MQYGGELFPYQRIRKIKNEENKPKVDEALRIVRMLTYFIVAFLISRVIMVNLMAPFGIAYLIAIIACEKGKIPLLAGGGTLLGYISLYGNVKNLPAYLIITSTLVGINYIIKGMDEKKELFLIFAAVFIESLIYQLLIIKLSPGVAFLTSFFETTCIFPLYFIINYSIICFKELKTTHLYSSEEIISMAVTVSLAIAGTWGINIYGVSIRNIVALTFIFFIGYIKGSPSGSASGVAMGTIIGVTSNDMITYVGVYGMCGLISGLFRETGKWMSGIAYLVAFAVLKMYSDIGIQFKIMEVLISSLIFFCIPQKIYKKLELELDWHKKKEYFKENYVNKVKDMLVGRLDSFSDVLINMSKVLEKLVDNDKLEIKNKSSALIENLADRVCSTCNMKSMCWKRETYYTYNAFGELIQSYQENKKEMPCELERKCTRRSLLIKNTEEIVNNYIINEMWRSRLSECRELLSGQIKIMANSVSEIVDEFNTDIKFNTDVENDIRRILNKNSIKYNNIFCFNNKNDRLVVKLSMEACGGRQLCIKEILPLINKVTNKCMCVSDEGCNIDSLMKNCNITLEETPKFHIASYVNRQCKEGESYAGDSYSFGKLPDGSYMTILSDGMGSGPQANKESSAAVELIEKFTKAGFSKLTAINTINSIMTIKFSENEKFSTLDLSSADLYEGEMDFMKVGAVASFIKRGDDVEVINSKTLPIGVLDKPDVDVTRKKIKNGDIIIMLSDGVIDYENKSAGKIDWIVDFLKGTKVTDPRELCNEIIEKAKELSGGKTRDDMTAIVQKIYSLY